MIRAVERVGRLLMERGYRLALAESCTGGMLAAMLTEPPGSSRYFVGGVVAYADEVKVALLGVAPETLAAYGAVSEQVAREMAAGARRVAGAEASASITGIAGPDGGTPEKPVGTVWIGASVGDRTACRLYTFDGDRDAVRRASAHAALELVESLLEES